MPSAPGRHAAIGSGCGDRPCTAKPAALTVATLLIALAGFASSAFAARPLDCSAQDVLSVIVAA